MKFFRFKSLGVRLFVLCIVCMAAAALPTMFYFFDLLGGIKSSKAESNGARMLSSLTVVSHSAYLSNNDARFDAAELRKSVDVLVKSYKKLSDNSALKKNPRLESSFSAEAIDAFVKKPDSGEPVVDMASHIAFQSGLFTNPHTNIHLFMDVSSNLFPKLYASIFKLSSILKKLPQTPDRLQINELSAAYVLLSEYSKELVGELRRVCSICSPEKSVSIVADIAKLNSAMGELNISISKIWQGKGFEGNVAIANLSLFERSAFELWTLSGKGLSEHLDMTGRGLKEKSKTAAIEIGGMFLAVLLIAFFMSRTILLEARRTRKFANMAVGEGVSQARDFFENTTHRINIFADIDSNIARLLDNYADVIDSSKEILESSLQLNEDAQSIVSTQKPRINGVSNGLLRIDAKINLRDKSDAALAASTQSLRDRLNAAEQLARSQNKSILDVSEEINGALVSASNIMSKLGALRGMADKLSVIAETFTGVADQANILSLNLAIETAKAGIKGSGFGTLAEQIKILSKRTVVSVIDIESIRDAILGTLDISAADTEKFLSALESDSKILREIDSALSELTSSLAKISTSTNAISVSLRERGAFDMSIQEAQDNLAKVDDALAEFFAFSKNAVSVINKTREKISGIKF